VAWPAVLTNHAIIPVWVAFSWTSKSHPSIIMSTFFKCFDPVVELGDVRHQSNDHAEVHWLPSSNIG
jgi:hypothetical protein